MKTRNAYLKNTLIKENDEILYQVTHVAKSGMSRHIKFYVIRDNQLLNLTYNICNALDYKYKDNTNSLYIRGCGMDMGFAVVFHLGRYLFNDGSRLNYRAI
jgi:hypothetical protein